MIGMQFEATWGPSKPLSELERLIEHRCDILYETARDAAVATVINAANSLRAQTKKTKPSAPVKAYVSMRPELIPSVFGRGRSLRRCLRNPLGHRVPMITPRRWVDDDPSGKKLFTYYVRPELPCDRPYLCIAESEDLVRKYEAKRIRRRKNALGGLAKYTLGLAMARLSTYNNVESAGVVAKRVAGKYASGSATGEGKMLDVELRSALEYAVAALKDGKGSIDLALKRAANKTFGHLMRRMREWYHPVDIGPCPFPELVGKRSVK